MNVALPLLLASLLTGNPFRADAPPTTELRTERFELHASDAALGTAKLLAERIEQDRTYIANLLGKDWPGVTEVRVGEGNNELAALWVPESAAPRWAAGMAHPRGNLVVLDATALRRDGGIRLIRHELAHVALAAFGGPDLPRWFQEGFAVIAAGEWDTASALAMVRVAREQTPMRALEFGFPDVPGDVPMAYAQSASFVEHLLRKGGRAGFVSLIEKVRDGMPFDEALAASIGPREALESEWREQISFRWSWLPVVSGTGTLFVVAAVLCVLGWRRRRRQHAEGLARLAAEEQQEEFIERLRAFEATLARYRGWAGFVANDAPMHLTRVEGEGENEPPPPPTQAEGETPPSGTRGPTLH